MWGITTGQRYTKVTGWVVVDTLSSMARSQDDMARQCTYLPRPRVATT